MKTFRINSIEAGRQAKDGSTGGLGRFFMILSDNVHTGTFSFTRDQMYEKLIKARYLADEIGNVITNRTLDKVEDSVFEADLIWHIAGSTFKDSEGELRETTSDGWHLNRANEKAFISARFRKTADLKDREENADAYASLKHKADVSRAFAMTILDSVPDPDPTHPEAHQLDVQQVANVANGKPAGKRAPRKPAEV